IRAISRTWTSSRSEATSPVTRPSDVSASPPECTAERPPPASQRPTTTSTDSQVAAPAASRHHCGTGRGRGTAAALAADGATADGPVGAAVAVVVGGVVLTCSGSGPKLGGSCEPDPVSAVGPARSSGQQLAHHVGADLDHERGDHDHEDHPDEAGPPRDGGAGAHVAADEVAGADQQADLPDHRALRDE